MSFKDSSLLPKGPITKEDQQKLLKAIEQLEADPLAYDFLEPVDYVGLGLMDYPTIITCPMDIGTVKRNLLNSSYSTMEGFFNDFNLIWENCRTYNMQASEICKLGLHCEKAFKKQIDKLFKANSSIKIDRRRRGAGIMTNDALSMNEKIGLAEKLKLLSDEGMVSIVKMIMKDCPKGVEEIRPNKIQLKIDFIDRNTYDVLLSSISLMTD